MYPLLADDVDYLLVMDEAQIGRLVEDVGMKPGHAMKFKSFLGHAQREATSAFA